MTEPGAEMLTVLDMAGRNTPRPILGMVSGCTASFGFMERPDMPALMAQNTMHGALFIRRT